MDPTVAVGYVRVSTEEQHLGSEAQQASIREFCKQQNLKLAGIYPDIGVSGALKMEKRRGLCSALEGVELCAAGRLVVARMDRLTRDAEYAKFLTRLFAASGVTILSADGVGNGDEPSDKLIRGVMAEFAEFERELISARTKAALALKKARGCRVGQIPYGYKLGEDGKLEIDVKEQAIISKINVLHRAGRSIRWICNHLNETEVPARPRPQRGVKSGEGPVGKWHYATVWQLAIDDKEAKEKKQ